MHAHVSTGSPKKCFVHADCGSFVFARCLLAQTTAVPSAPIVPRGALSVGTILCTTGKITPYILLPTPKDTSPQLFSSRHPGAPSHSNICTSWETIVGSTRLLQYHTRYHCHVLQIVCDDYFLGAMLVTLSCENLYL